MGRLSFFPGSDDDGESPLPPPDAQSASDSPPKRRGRPPGSTNKTTLTELETRLREKLEEDVVGPLTIASPLAGQVMIDRADRTTKAAIRIASKNPKVRKGIEKAIESSDWLTVAMFPLAIAVAFAVEYGMMGANAIPARAVGIPDVWAEVYPDEPPTPSARGKKRSTLYDRVRQPDFDPASVLDEDMAA